MIEDLARVVTAAESHQIGASEIIEIVLNKFRPTDVHDAVEQLLNRVNMKETYREILAALRNLGRGGRLPQSTRTVQHVAAAVALSSESSQTLDDDEIRSALVEMSNASRGMLRVNENAIILNGDLDELERRIASLTGDPGLPRRPGTFRDSGEG